MTSVKVKFRPSSLPEREGVIYIQVIHNRIVRQISTAYKIFPHEWDPTSETILTSGERHYLLSSMQEQLDWDIARLEKVITQLQKERRRYAADDVVARFHRLSRELSLCNFMHSVIAQLTELGRQRTAETYVATLRSFMHFRQEQDLPLDGITSELLQLYQAWLKARQVRPNSISFYMRILRAVYNRAVDKGLTEQRFPFRHVYTGIEKTVKRAIPIKSLKTLKELDLSAKPQMAFARDMFLFSFYTRGMSFIDMAFLRPSDLRQGILTYRRRKTGQQLTIRWERCMAEILERHPSTHPDYLLPIIKMPDNERQQYQNMLHKVNSQLKRISGLLQLPRPLTMYVARHSWASAAKSKNIPLSVISEGMGHDSEKTTQIYLASLETNIVDRANKKILDLL